MSDSVDSVVDTVKDKKTKPKKSEKKSNVVCMRPSAVERQLRRNPNSYAALMADVCRATQEM